MGKLLTRDEILQANDLQTEEVEVPEWGGSVLVRGMTGTERDAFEESIIEVKGKKQNINMQNLRAKLISKTVVDENGNPIFTPGDVDALGKKSAAALSRVFAVAQRLSGMSDEDLDELTKNSESGQSDSSTSL